MFTVHLAKETFKFSCSHFTILSADKAERLHGHNYQLRAEIAVSELDPKLGLAFDFNAVKPRLRDFCEDLDERILLPLRSPYLQVQQSTESVDVRFGKKHYLFPAEDTLCLPLANITSEELARFAAIRLSEAMRSLPGWTALELHIEETRGQSVSFRQAR